MATQEVSDALEKIADAWHVLTGAAERLAPEAGALTPLAGKIMGLVAAGNPLTEASEAALSVLVDVFKDAEAHRASQVPSPPVSPNPAPWTIATPAQPIEAQAAAAVAASGGSVSDSPGPATPDVVTAGDQVVSAG